MQQHWWFTFVSHLVGCLARLVTGNTGNGASVAECSSLDHEGVVACLIDQNLVCGIVHHLASIDIPCYLHRESIIMLQKQRNDNLSTLC